MKKYLKRSICFLMMMAMLFTVMAVPACALSFESVNYVMTNEEIDEAIAEGSSDTVTVEIGDVSPNMTVKVPAAGVKKIAASGKTLTVKTTDAVLIVNQTALQSAAGQIGDSGELVLSNKMFPNLTAQQSLALLKYRPLLYLCTSMTYNGKELTMSKGGYITAKLYATSVAGIDVTKYTVALWTGDGKMTEIETVYQDGALVAQLEKLAVYAVIGRSSPIVCKHTSVAVAAVAPTCESTGLTEGAKCSNCGEILTAQTEVPALGHDYEKTVVKEPTCGEEGLAKFVCKNDKSHTYEEKIAATKEHDYSYTDGICSVCGGKNPEFAPNPFTDVAETDYFYGPVMWAVGNKITGGVGEGLFGPNQGCTRGQVVTFLWAAAGRPEPSSTDNPFNDVSDSDYFFKAVLWAVENKITGGLGEGVFGPHESCTRGQIVTFLWASQGKPDVEGTSTFEDVADTDWYAKPVIWAAENKVTGGVAPGQFGPNNTCTRGQVVTFLNKVYG